MASERGNRLELVEYDAAGGIFEKVVLALVSGFSTEETDTLYFQLHDNAGLPPPGAVPLRCWPVAAGGTFSYAPALDGLKFASGYTWAVSSTPDIMTVAPAALFWVQSEGRIVG